MKTSTKIKIRNNFFETNSSSTHAIVVDAKGINIKVNPKDISVNHYEIEAGEYGWEEALYKTVSDKLDYVYTIYLVLDEEEKFINLLSKVTGWSKDSIKGIILESSYYYIDHGYEYKSELDTISDNFEEIVFGNSVIVTSNDNCNSGIMTYNCETKEYDIIVKGTPYISKKDLIINKGN